MRGSATARRTPPEARAEPGAADVPLPTRRRGGARHNVPALRAPDRGARLPGRTPGRVPARRDGLGQDVVDDRRGRSGRRAHRPGDHRRRGAHAHRARVRAPQPGPQGPGPRARQRPDHRRRGDRLLRARPLAPGLAPAHGPRPGISWCSTKARRCARPRPNRPAPSSRRSGRCGRKQHGSGSCPARSCRTTGSKSSIRSPPACSARRAATKSTGATSAFCAPPIGAGSTSPTATSQSSRRRSRPTSCAAARAT